MKKEMKSTRTVSCLLVLPVVIALGAAPARAEEADEMRSAEAMFEEGARLFEAGRYREAVPLFEAAERIAPNPLNLRSIVRCYQQLGEYETALRWMEQLLARSDLSPADRTEAEELRDDIQAAQRAATQAVENPPDAQLEEAPAAVEPSLEESLGVEAPTEETPAVPPEEAPYQDVAEPTRGERPSLAGPLALLGIGLGLALGGGVLDVLAFVRSDPDGVGQFETYEAFDNWRSDARSYAIVGDVLVGVGAVVTVVGLIWTLVRRSRRSPGYAAGAGLSLEAGRSGTPLGASAYIRGGTR
jgi:tetratricopeptide (TPR) repeat protein